MDRSPRRRSNTDAQHSFARIPSANIQRSVFNRSCGTKTTFQAGYLVPIFADEALPGDTINLRATIFARLSTLSAPIMDNIFLDVFFFAVPIRLIWDNWEKFNGAQTDPGDSTDYTVPVMEAPPSTGYAAESLSDYLGIPTEIAELEHSSLWHRAYNLIWNEWFRDQDLQNSVVVDTDDGPDDDTDYVLLQRGKRHDYFTSCRPWPQKGTAVDLPLGSTAPLTLDAGEVVDVDPKSSYPTWDRASTGHIRNLEFDGSTQNADWNTSTSVNEAAYWSDPQLEVDLAGVAGTVDLSSATAATINSLRQSFQIQRLLERDARGGTRYVETIRSHFGVTSPDFRLQRPEFLGGGTIPIIASQVEVTAINTGAGVYPGDLYSYGLGMGDNNHFVQSFTEHCVILGLIAARADLNYQQGLPRMFSRSTRYDFYWPALAHIGEQSVLNKEIYAQNDSNDDLVFGYQERYAEYRYKPSQVTGVFRSNHSNTLDLWHLSQEFSALPTLGATFIVENPPLDRVILVADQHFLLDAHFTFKHARPMPTYSVPGLIDHF